MPTNALRRQLAINAQFLIDNRRWIDYVQIRPFKLYQKSTLMHDFLQNRTVGFDCSASIVQLYYMTGCKDPTGFNFNGDGNTESMMSHLKHYPNPIDAHPGAIIIFNADQPLAIQHAVMVMEQGADPMCFTHGGQGDPQKHRLSWLKPGFRGSLVCLDVSPL